MTTILLAGGGHAHVEVLRRFAIGRAPGCRLAIVTPATHASYSGMLPGLIAGHYDWAACHIDVRALAAAADAVWHETSVAGIDARAGHVDCADGTRIAFDLLSLDVGSVPAGQDVPGMREHAVPVRPAGKLLEACATRCARGSAPPGRIAVVGGGAASVEIALALRHRLSQHGRVPDVTLVADALVPASPPRVQRLVRRALAARGVSVRCGALVDGVMPGAVRRADGSTLDVDLIVWATGPAAHAWLASTDLALDARGFVAVHDTLQSLSHANVFAAGDVATLVDAPVAKAGVFAVRQGPYLDENLRRAARGAALRPYRPQRRFLSLLATGDRHAIASYGPFAWQGRWVWRWKDAIDRRFMARYAEVGRGGSGTAA